MLGLQMLSRRHPRWHRDSLAHRPFSPSDPPIFHFHFSIFLSFLPLSLLECAVTRFPPLTLLECAVTKTPSRKSFRMRSCEKRWGEGDHVFPVRRSYFFKNRRSRITAHKCSRGDSSLFHQSPVKGDVKPLV